MRNNFLRSVAAVVIVAGATIVFPSMSAAQTPDMGGGYTNAIPVPIDDPQVKAIAGALFEPAGPEGNRPFPVVIYVSGCGGLNWAPDIALQEQVINHLTASGFATFILDPFTPCGEMMVICAKYTPEEEAKYRARGGNDVLAAFSRRCPTSTQAGSSCKVIPTEPPPHSSRSMPALR